MQSKKDGKDQESIQSSTTPDPGYQWESNKLLVRHHKRGQDNLQIYCNNILSNSLLLLDTFEPVHEISNNVACATSIASD